MYKCKICGVEFEEYNSLSRHTSKSHQIKVDECFVNYKLSGVWPLCKCGCNQKTKYSYELKGFREYCKGHYSRVHNNWGHNQSAIDKSSETRRKQFSSGERTVWNDGLTMETDLRVKKNAEATSLAFTDSRRKEYSDIMRKNRLDGTVPTLYGKDSSQWKGGISEINIIARADKRLYDEWKYPILIRDGFKCVMCGSSDKLHIHHDKETMSDIVKKHMPDIEDIIDFELKKLIAAKIVDYHINNPVSAITLCSECHNNLHPSLNFKH
jgi:hypothetical protein